MRKFTYILLLIVIIYSFGCAEEVISVNESYNEKKIVLKKGQILNISLNSHPTAGYRWEIIELEEKVLKQEGDVEFKSISDDVGAPCLEIFRFKSVDIDETEILMFYQRSWEEEEPEKVFRLIVETK